MICVGGRAARSSELLHFHGWRSSKKYYRCAEPAYLPQCPLPKHWLRNGGLNQTAFFLYLFIRDVADGDLVG